jgi:hypothetical protein
MHRVKGLKKVDPLIFAAYLWDMPPIAITSEFELAYTRAQHRLEQQLADSVPALGAFFAPSSWKGVSRRARANERGRSRSPRQPEATTSTHHATAASAPYAAAGSSAPGAASK